LLNFHNEVQWFRCFWEVIFFWGILHILNKLCILEGMRWLRNHSDL
jgi:hypothetical protein